MRATPAVALNDGGTCYGDRHQLNVAHNLVASKLMFPPLASNVMPAGLGEPSKLDSLKQFLRTQHRRVVWCAIILRIERIRLHHPTRDQFIISVR